jgi:hypothetical protein
MVRGILAGGILFLMAGCATAPAPTLQTGPDAEVTADGLVRVDNSVVPLAFWKPGLDLTPYTRFILDPVVVAYQRDPGNNRRSDIGGTVKNFALTPEQMERLRSHFQDAVLEALTRDGGYELTTEPGPEVLRLTCSLLDLVVRVPTESQGMEDVYTRSYGMVSLVMELRDSETGEILARGGDRQDLSRNSNFKLSEVSPIYVETEVDYLFGYWADLLRERLDSFREMKVEGAPG